MGILGKAKRSVIRTIATNRTALPVRALHKAAVFIDDAYHNRGSEFHENGEADVLKRLAPVDIPPTERAVYADFSDLSGFVKRMRSEGLASGECSHCNQFVSKMIVAFESVKHIWKIRLTRSAPMMSPSMRRNSSSF